MLDGQMQKIIFFTGYDLSIDGFLYSEYLKDIEEINAIRADNVAVHGKCRFRENNFTYIVKSDERGKYDSQISSFPSLTFRCYEKDDLPDYDWLPKFDDSDTSYSDIETNIMQSNEYSKKSMKDFIC